MDISGSDVILCKQPFTLSSFFLLPVDAEYPGERFGLCILTKFPGDTCAHYHLRNAVPGDDRASSWREHGSLPCGLKESHPGGLPLEIYLRLARVLEVKFY